MRHTFPLLLCLAAAGCGDSFAEFYGETAAIKSIRTVHEAQLQHRNRFGGYAASLDALGINSIVTARSCGKFFGVFYEASQPAYRLTMTAFRDAYTVHADPVDQPKTGRRTFFSDECMVIRQSFDGRPATINSNRIDLN